MWIARSLLICVVQMLADPYDAASPLAKHLQDVCVSLDKVRSPMRDSTL